MTIEDLGYILPIIENEEDLRRARLEATPLTEWYIGRRAHALLADAAFDKLHPRGKDGKFIKVLGWVKWLTPDGKWLRGQVESMSSGGVVMVKLDKEYQGGDHVGVTNPTKSLYTLPTPKAKLDLPDPTKSGGDEKHGFKKVGGQAGSNTGALYEKGGEVGLPEGVVEEKVGLYELNKLPTVDPSKFTPAITGKIHLVESTSGTHALIIGDDPDADRPLVTDLVTGQKLHTSALAGLPVIKAKDDESAMAEIASKAPSGAVGDGGKFYVKKNKDVSHNRNELTANRLYELAGVNVPDVFEGEDGLTVGSKYTEADEVHSLSQATDEELSLVRKDFVIDAWLSSWDVVGLELDNIIIVDGHPQRIDSGGSLMYRAQGSPKGDLFGKEVTELETLKDPSKNAQAAQIFGPITDEELDDGLKRLESLTPDEIHKTIDAVWEGDPWSADQLYDVLMSRRADILTKLTGLTPVDTAEDTTPDLTPTSSTVEAHAPNVEADDIIYGSTVHVSLPSGQIVSGVWEADPDSTGAFISNEATGEMWEGEGLDQNHIYQNSDLPNGAKLTNAEDIHIGQAVRLYAGQIAWSGPPSHTLVGGSHSDDSDEDSPWLLDFAPIGGGLEVELEVPQGAPFVKWDNASDYLAEDDPPLESLVEEVDAPKATYSTKNFSKLKPGDQIQLIKWGTALPGEATKPNAEVVVSNGNSVNAKITNLRAFLADHDMDPASTNYTQGQEVSWSGSGKVAVWEKSHTTKFAEGLEIGDPPPKVEKGIFSGQAELEIGDGVHINVHEGGTKSDDADAPNAVVVGTAPNGAMLLKLTNPEDAAAYLKNYTDAGTGPDDTEITWFLDGGGIVWKNWEAQAPATETAPAAPKHGDLISHSEIKVGDRIYVKPGTDEPGDVDPEHPANATVTKVNEPDADDDIPVYWEMDDGSEFAGNWAFFMHNHASSEGLGYIVGRGTGKEVKAPFGLEDETPAPAYGDMVIKSVGELKPGDKFWLQNGSTVEDKTYVPNTPPNYMIDSKSPGPDHAFYVHSIFTPEDPSFLWAMPENTVVVEGLATAEEKTNPDGKVWHPADWAMPQSELVTFSEQHDEFTTPVGVNAGGDPVPVGYALWTSPDHAGWVVVQVGTSNTTYIPQRDPDLSSAQDKKDWALATAVSLRQAFNDPDWDPPEYVKTLAGFAPGSTGADTVTTVKGADIKVGDKVLFSGGVVQMAAGGDVPNATITKVSALDPVGDFMVTLDADDDPDGTPFHWVFQANDYNVVKSGTAGHAPRQSGVVTITGDQIEVGDLVNWGGGVGSIKGVKDFDGGATPSVKVLEVGQPDSDGDVVVMVEGAKAGKYMFKSFDYNVIKAPAAAPGPVGNKPVNQLAADLKPGDKIWTQGGTTLTGTPSTPPNAEVVSVEHTNGDWKATLKKIGEGGPFGEKPIGHEYGWYLPSSGGVAVIHRAPVEAEVIEVPAVQTIPKPVAPPDFPMGSATTLELLDGSLVHVGTKVHHVTKGWDGTIKSIADQDKYPNYVWAVKAGQTKPTLTSLKKVTSYGTDQGAVGTELDKNGKELKIGQTVEAGTGKGKGIGVITSVSPAINSVQVTINGKSLWKKTSTVTILGEDTDPAVIAAKAQVATPVEPVVNYDEPDIPQVAYQSDDDKGKWIGTGRKLMKDGYRPYNGMPVKDKAGKKYIVVGWGEGATTKNQMKLMSVDEVVAYDPKVVKRAVNTLTVDFDDPIWKAPTASKLYLQANPGYANGTNGSAVQLDLAEGEMVYRINGKSGYTTYYTVKPSGGYGSAIGGAQGFSKFETAVGSILHPLTGSRVTVVARGSKASDNVIVGKSGYPGLKSESDLTMPSPILVKATDIESGTPVEVLIAKTGHGGKMLGHTPISPGDAPQDTPVTPAPTKLTPEPEADLVPKNAAEAAGVAPVESKTIQPSGGGPTGLDPLEVVTGEPPKFVSVQSQGSIQPPPKPDASGKAKVTSSVPPVDLPKLTGGSGQFDVVPPIPEAHSVVGSAQYVLDHKADKDPSTGASFSITDGDKLEDQSIRFQVVVGADGQEYLEAKVKLTRAAADDIGMKLLMEEGGSKTTGAWVKDDMNVKDLVDGDLISVKDGHSYKVYGKEVQILKPQSGDQPNVRVVGTPTFIGKPSGPEGASDVDVWRVTVVDSQGNLSQVDIEDRGTTGDFPKYHYDWNKVVHTAGKNIVVHPQAAAEGWVRTGDTGLLPTKGTWDEKGRKVYTSNWLSAPSTTGGYKGSTLVRQFEDGSNVAFSYAMTSEPDHTINSANSSVQGPRHGSLVNNVFIRIPADKAADREGLAEALTQGLESVGVPVEAHRPPTEQEVRKLAINKVAQLIATPWHPGVGTNGTGYDGDGDTDKVLANLAKQVHMDKITMDNVVTYVEPDGRVWVGFTSDVAEAIRQAQNGGSGITYFQHDIYTGQDGALNILSGTHDGLLASEERFTRGATSITGMSSTADVQIGTGDRLYLHSKSSSHIGSDSWTVVFSARSVDRTTEVYPGTASDQWGTHKPNWITLQSGYEAMYKRTMPPDMVAYVTTSSESARKSLIKQLHARGITTYGGRPIEEVVIYDTSIIDVNSEEFQALGTETLGMLPLTSVATP